MMSRSLPPSLVALVACACLAPALLLGASPQAIELGKQGTEAIKRAEYQKAVDALSEAIKIDEDYGDAFLQRCYSRYKLEQFRDAIADCTEAFRLDPKNAEAYYLRGVIRSENLGDNRKAVSDFDQAIVLDAKHAWAYLKRGNARFRLGDKTGGLNDYSRAISIDPKAGDAYFNRGIARYNTGDKDGAAEDFRQAAKLHREQGKQEDFKRDTAAIEKVQSELPK